MSRTPRPTLRSMGLAEILDTFRSYLGLGKTAPLGPIDTRASLASFLETRASFIAQTSLYGYLRTRAGMRYPELFEDDAFVDGINIAKWEIWLDCLSDLSVYAGSRIAQAMPRDAEKVGPMMRDVLDDILARTGTPPDAGSEFAAHADRVRERIDQTRWRLVGDMEAAFTDSPASVVQWSPVIDKLKQLDEEIVRNSVRFHWQEVRRDFLRYFDAAAILQDT